MSQRLITVCDFCDAQSVTHPQVYGISIAAMERIKAWRKYEGSDFCSERCLYEHLKRKIAPNSKPLEIEGIKSGWISIKEQLPDFNDKEEVLVLLKDGSRHAYTPAALAHQVNLCAESPMSWTPTHWTPMPALPPIL